MSLVSQHIKVEIVDGNNYPISGLDNILYYYIFGTTTLTSNWSITASNPVVGMRCYFSFNPTITLGGNHIYVLGTQIPDFLSTKKFDVHSYYNGSAWVNKVFVDISESSIIETNDITDKAVTNAKLASTSAGSIKVGTGSGVTDVDAKTLCAILMGDGSTVGSTTISGDVTFPSYGTSLISNNAVDNNKLNDIPRGCVKVGGIGNAPTDLVASGDGCILIGDGTDIKSKALDNYVKNSVEISSGKFQLTNDSSVPGSYMFYGTNQTGVRGYYAQPKVYKAMLSQSGTTAPTSVELSSTIGVVTINYVAPGVYTIVCAGAFPVDKTFVAIQNVSVTGDGINGYISAGRTNDNTIAINTYDPVDPSIAANGILTNSWFTIEVYS